MSLQIRYNRVTTPSGTDPDHIVARQPVSFSAAAEEGAVAQSQLIVDDTDSTLDYVGLRRVYAFETAAPAHNQMVFNGYLQDRTIGRQPGEGMDSDEAITALDRRWNLTVADTNSLLSRRLITGADGDRPEETDIARIQWLLDSNDAYLSNPHDTWENPSPYIDTSGPITMSATDTRGSTAFDVLNDCAQRSGKLWFAAYYEANDTVPPTNGGSIALHYYEAESAYYPSTLRLSNVIADIDNVTTFAPLPDALLSVDPGRNYSGVYLTFDGPGSPIYVQSTSVENLFQRRDAAVSNQYVKTVAEATALANRYLTDAATEDNRITCRFVVAKQYVNDLREGQLFDAKFSHLTDYADFTSMRCLRRTVTQTSDENFYEIAVELSPQVAPPTVVQNMTATFIGSYIEATWPVGVPSVGSACVSMLALRSEDDTTSGAQSMTDGTFATFVAGTAYAHVADTYRLALSTRIPTASDTEYLRWPFDGHGGYGGTARPRSHSVEIGGVTTFGTAVSTAATAGSATPTSCVVHADGPGVVIYGMMFDYPGPEDHIGWAGVGYPLGFTVTADAPGVLLSVGYGTGGNGFQPLSWLAYQIVTAAGDYSISFSLTPATGEGDPLSSYYMSRIGIWVG